MSMMMPGNEAEIDLDVSHRPEVDLMPVELNWNVMDATGRPAS